MTDLTTVVSGVLEEVTAELSWLAGSDATWEVLDCVLREGLSQLYQADLLAGTDDPDPDITALLGQRVTIRFRRGHIERALHGIVCRAEDREHHRDGRALLSLQVVPELWFLTRRRDSRIFAHEPTHRIVRRVLDAAGVYPGDRLVLQLRLDEPTVHATREYCVQYQESDLDFIRRLLEEEGTHFYFRHDGDAGETLVLSDGERATLEGTYVPLDNGPERATEVSYVTSDDLALERHQAIDRFQGRADVQSTSLTLRDFDFTNARQRELWTASQQRAASRELPVYEHPARMIFTGDGSDVHGAGPGVGEHFLGELRGASGGMLGSAMDDNLGERVRAAIPALPYPATPRFGGNTGGLLASRRLEEHICRGHVFEGAGTVIGMSAGHWFDLVDHNRDTLNRQYLLTWVQHEMRSATWTIADRPQYRNRFGCVARSVVHRPARLTPRPRIHGTHTGTVVGGPGEEMHVDQYGRVRVQFHWDRQHRFDDNLEGIPQGEPRNVCWVRCAQAWAGPHWGSVFIPRVGMEVVVSFFEGDPDHPIVVGAVYNAANPPPYSLPTNYHRSTIMSRSIPLSGLPGGRQGFNELRFDDLKGSEQVYVHAEKDFTEVVRNHHETYVGGSQDVEVRRDQTNSVAGSQMESVAHDQLVTVGCTQSTQVGVNRAMHVGGVEMATAVKGRVTSAGLFEGNVVQGYHLHYVIPATEASASARPEIAEVMRAATAIGAAAAGQAPAAADGSGRAGEGGEGGGAPAEPGTLPDGTPLPTVTTAGDGDQSVDWTGDGTDGTTEPAEGEGEGEGDQEQAPGTPGGPLEQYIVEGNRRKRVTGWERVSINERHVQITEDDHLTASGRVLVTGAMVGLASNSGTTKGLSLLEEDDDRARLFRGGDQELVMAHDGVALADGPDRALVMGDDGVILRTKEGELTLRQGPEDDPCGMVIEDGEIAIFAKGDHTYIEVLQRRIKVDAADEIRLVNNGGAEIKMKSDGSIEIRGTKVEVFGPFQVH